MAQKGFALLVPVPSLIRLSHIRPQRPRAVGEADGELKIATEPPSLSSCIAAEGGNAGRKGRDVRRCLASSPSASPSRRAGWGR